MTLTVYSRLAEPPSELGTIELDAGRVVVTETGGPPSLRAMVEGVIVLDPRGTGRRLTPADGDAFLRGLAGEIGHGGYYEVGIGA